MNDFNENSPSAPFNRRAIPSDARFDTFVAPDGWPIRCLRWPAQRDPAEGSFLALGGRGDFIEKYLEMLGHVRALGWNVESADWRGQGGSGRTIANRSVGHIADFGDWIDDLAAYVIDWKARTPGPHVVLGHSMGGHLVLRALAEQAIAVDGAILSAPMLGFSGPVPNALGRLIARIGASIGSPERPVWKASEKPFSPESMRPKLLTHCPNRYSDEPFWWEENPDTKLGPASWGWMKAAYDSFRVLNAPGAIEAIRTPVLILNAGTDRLVDPKTTRRIAGRLSNCILVEFGPESAHEILREADAPRGRAFEAIGVFLGRMHGYYGR